MTSTCKKWELASALHKLKKEQEEFKEALYFMQKGYHSLMHGWRFYDAEYEKEWIARYVLETDVAVQSILITLAREIVNTQLAFDRINANIA